MNFDRENPLDLFIVTPEPELTEFEQEVSDIVEYCKEHGEHVAFDYAKRHAKTLLDLAKNELARQGEVITLDKLPPYDKGFQDGKAEAMADLERAVTCGNVDNIPKWLVEELNKAFEKGQESSHEGYIRGYTNGYKDAEKQYNESVAYHYSEPVPPGVAYKSPQCYTDVMVTPNISSGTSTFKAEG